MNSTSNYYPWRVLTRICTLWLATSLLAGPAGAQYSFTVLRSFGGQASDGNQPFATLAKGSDGLFYGATDGGGLAQAGTLFKVNQDGSGYSVLWTFGATPADGSNTWATPVEGTGGALYGTTRAGGSNRLGTIYKLNKDGTGYAILHTFGSAPGDGASPYHGVIEASDGALYGLTYLGGTNAGGTAFRLNTDGSGYAVLRSFPSTETGGGYNPWGTFVEAGDGLLYGSSVRGGASGGGTLFKMQKDGGGFTLLHSFGAAGDGYSPTAPLLEGTDGSFYGTTVGGGAGSHGTVFTLERGGSSYRIIHSFSATGEEGLAPGDGDGGLLEGVDGSLYGVCNAGGLAGFGTAFKLEKDGSGFGVVHSFESAEGNQIRAALVQGTNSALYGTAVLGGAEGLGTLFEIQVPLSPLTFAQTPRSQAVSAGTNVIFKALARSSFPPVAYQWQFHGSNLDGGIYSALTLSNAQPADGGDYVVTVGDGAHSMLSATCQLSVVLGPIILEQPRAQIAPRGSDVTYALSAISGSPPMSYQWQFNGVETPGATSPALMLRGVQFTNAGAYAALVSDSRGAVTSVVANLGVYDNDVWRFATWTGSTGASSNALPTNTVIFLSAAGEAYIDDISLVPLSGPSAGGNVLTNGDFEAPLSSGPWNVPATMSGSILTNTYAHSGSNSLHVVAPSGPPLNVIRQPLLRLNTNVLCTLSFWYHAAPGVGSNGLTVRWLPGTLVGTNVSLQPVGLTPGFASQPGNLALPAGGGATFDALAFGSEPLSYRWAKGGIMLTDDGRITGSTTPRLSLANVQPADSGGYSVTVTNLLGSSNSATATLSVLAAPPPLLSVARQGTNLVISLPQTPGVWLLEAASKLGTGAVWSPSGTALSTQQGTLTATITLGISNEFFRVRKE